MFCTRAYKDQTNGTFAEINKQIKMEILVIAGQLLLSLSILVVLHELGHFIPAKLFKTRVEKFYLFFDPWFSLFKFKKGGTEYGIGWLPLGGYVKISGMIDESMDTEQMKKEPQPWEFRSKPAWQRLIIMIGGVVVNFLLGIFIFAMILWTFGEKYLPNENAAYGIQVDSIGYAMGFRNGDKIMEVQGAVFQKFEPNLIKKDIVVNNVRTVKVHRDGQEVDVTIDPEFITALSSYGNKDMAVIGLRFPYVVGKIVEGGPAENAGLKVGDRLIGVNGKETLHYSEFMETIIQHPSQEVMLAVERDGVPIQVNITTNEEGKIAVGNLSPTEFMQMEREEYALLSSFPAGAAKAYNFLADQVKAFGKMFSGQIKASESLGGFVSMSKLFPYPFDWESFWRITAILSLILGFMNLLPIPALDGGHVLFLLYEVVTGKKPSDKFMEIATMAGFFFILALLLYANGLDLMRLWK